MEPLALIHTRSAAKASRPIRRRCAAVDRHAPRSRRCAPAVTVKPISRCACVHAVRLPRRRDARLPEARGHWLDAGAQSEFDMSGELIAGRRVRAAAGTARQPRAERRSARVVRGVLPHRAIAVATSTTNPVWKRSWPRSSATSPPCAATASARSRRTWRAREGGGTVVKKFPCVARARDPRRGRRAELAHGRARLVPPRARGRRRDRRVPTCACPASRPATS